MSAVDLVGMHWVPSDGIDITTNFDQIFADYALCTSGKTLWSRTALDRKRQIENSQYAWWKSLYEEQAKPHTIAQMHIPTPELIPLVRGPEEDKDVDKFNWTETPLAPQFSFHSGGTPERNPHSPFTYLVRRNHAYYNALQTPITEPSPTGNNYYSQLRRHALQLNSTTAPNIALKRHPP